MGYLNPRFAASRALRKNLCRPRHSSGVFVSVVLAILVLGASGVAAKSFSYDLAGELMSPYCPGRTLSSCPSPQAAELVQWMVVQEAGGATREEIIDMLVERFGEEILGAPPAKGAMLWAYVVPIAGFVLGGALVVVALRRLVARDVVKDAASGHAVGAAGAKADDDLAKLVDAELDDIATRG